MATQGKPWIEEQRINRILIMSELYVSGIGEASWERDWNEASHRTPPHREEWEGLGSGAANLIYVHRPIEEPTTDTDRPSHENAGGDGNGTGDGIIYTSE